MAGTSIRWGGRRLALLSLLVLTAAASGCAPAEQLGNEEAAARAASDFLGAIASGNAGYAWEHLTPETRRELFGNDEGDFGREVAAANWEAFRWQVGPVANHEIVWVVNVEVDPAVIPNFMMDSRLVGRYGSEGLVLLVQFDASNSYAVAGQSLASDLP